MPVQMHGMPHHRHVGEREPGSVPFFDGQRFGLVVVPTVDRPLVAHHVPPEVCHEIDTGAIASRQNDTFGCSERLDRAHSTCQFPREERRVGRSARACTQQRPSLSVLTLGRGDEREYTVLDRDDHVVALTHAEEKRIDFCRYDRKTVRMGHGHHVIGKGDSKSGIRTRVDDANTHTLTGSGRESCRCRSYPPVDQIVRIADVTRVPTEQSA